MLPLTPYLQKLLAQQVLSRAESADAMRIILKESNREQISAFLTLLKYRGITANELSGLLEELRTQTLSFAMPYPVLDIVGTGGDMANTVNISTGAAILMAACGIPVVKHGNRAVSSLCGAADVLEHFGIPLSVSPEQVYASVKEANIAFLFAPHFNPVLVQLRSIRKALGLPTVFNLLGPLLNPVQPPYLMMGVADHASLTLMSEVIQQLSCIKRAVVFHGNGLDELTTLGTHDAYFIQDGKKQTMEIDPIQLGFTRGTLDELKGGTVECNANLLINAFHGHPSSLSDALILNAGVGLLIYARVPTLAEGIALARETLAQGKAFITLQQWIAFFNPSTKEQH